MLSKPIQFGFFFNQGDVTEMDNRAIVFFLRLWPFQGKLEPRRTRTGFFEMNRCVCEFFIIV